MQYQKILNTIYYQIKFLVPRYFQIWMRRKLILLKRSRHEANWPILAKAGKRPENFSGWPNNKKFALVLTHDVDTAGGQDKCLELSKLEHQLGFRSSFNFVPERYKVYENIHSQLRKNGFEVGVHGLNHDGNLFRSKSIFKERSKKINHYIRRWNANGFRAPAMHHNLNWIHTLDIKYDASTFDTDPFEPQPDGCATIFPFWVSKDASSDGYIELPYTLPQDFTVFILLKDYKLRIWHKKLDWIVKHNGMALLNTHPDYMCFEDRCIRYEEYYVNLYKMFLQYIKNKYSGQYWHALPAEVAKFWKKHFVINNAS